MNYILKNENAVYFECGFSCDNVIYLNLGKESFFITDGRYTHEASQNVKKATVIDGKKELIQKTKAILKSLKIKKLTYDPTEWNISEYNGLFASLKITLTPAVKFSQQKRAIKTNKEIELIKKAVKLGEKAFDNFSRYINVANIQSEQKLAFVCESSLRSFGKYEISFNPIVAVNENAAKPHALASKTPLRRGDLLLVDAGVKYRRYCSDRTRTAYFDKDINFSKEQNFKSKKIQNVYDTVRMAQEEAIKMIKPGVKASDIDAKARETIQKAGFGKYFIHSTGHGVGLDIHEYPVISQKSTAVIEENMIFTVEPGIYIADEFGVRIEDMVRVTSNGVEIL